MTRIHAPVKLFFRLARLARLAALLALAVLLSAQLPAQTATGAATPVVTSTTAKAIFAGGCFWCVESDFDKVPGVISTTSGYTGGRTANPTYQQVSSHTTGHAEAVEVLFDPTKVSYQSLVEHYWHTIDPTVKDQQFCDHGSPYRTAIFAQDATQLKTAQASRDALEKNQTIQGTHRHRDRAGRGLLPG